MAAVIVVCLLLGCVCWCGPVLAGQLQWGHGAAAFGEVIGLRRRFAVGVGAAQRDTGGGEQEDCAGQQGLVEACGERVGAEGVGREQGAGACGGDGGEDRKPRARSRAAAWVIMAAPWTGLIGPVDGNSKWTD